MDARARPVRVAFLIGTLDVGGAETQLVRLANGLDRARFAPSIICLWQGGELADAVSLDVPVIKADLLRLRPHSPVARGLVGVRILASLLRTLRRQRPDIVHAYLAGAYVLGGLAAWTLRVPIIVASRRGLTSAESLGWGRSFAQLANRVIDVQICNSQAVRDWAIARERLGVERTRVVYNGIDVPALGPPPPLPEAWHTEGGAAAMVANFIHYKGHREVLRAVARVVMRHPSFRLVLMGDGPERAALTDLARELGISDQVIFAGLRRNAADLMQAFDFTLLGSSEEGFPNALMESMARAVPVVSTAVGGVPELVTDGVHGRLVAFGDVDAMAGAITWMIEHPAERRRMGIAARARIEKEYSTARMVGETEAVYEELLKR